MSMSINAGVSSSALNQATQSLQRSDERISSGQRINSARDDAAGLAISTAMGSQSQGQTQAIRNAGDGISMAQTAQGALKSVTENVQRIRELSVQANNGIYTDSDRQLLNKEVQALTSSIQDTLKNSNFNGRSLFDGQQTASFQVGPNAGNTIDVDATNLRAEAEELGLSSIDISTPEGATQALEFADSLLNRFSQEATSVGAVQNRFESRINSLEQENISTQAARSRIADADIAKEASDRAAADVQSQVAIAMQGQANAQKGQVLRLLGS